MRKFIISLAALLAITAGPLLAQQGNQVIPQGGGTGSATNPASPVMGFYLSNTCPSSNTGQCFFTAADTQQANSCSYSSASTTVTCFAQLYNVSGSVTSNVATYTSPVSIPPSWASGNSVTVTGFLGSDTYLNATCTLSTVTTNTVTCPLTHANGSSTSFGILTNSNVGPFIAADAGTSKRIFGFATCSAYQNLSANTNNAPMTTTGAPLTVSTFTSSLSVVVSANPASTVASGGCVIWGHPDDTGWAAVDAAMQNVSGCPRLFLAAANYMTTVPHSFVQPTACAGLGSTYPFSAALANVFYAAGFEVEGRGRGPTVVFMTPGFPESGPGCVNGLSKLACWDIPVEGRWSGIQFTGGGDYEAYNVPSGDYIFEVDGPASMEQVTCINFGGLDKTGGTGTTGFLPTWWTQLDQVDFSGCGNTNMTIPTGAVVTAHRLALENPGAGGWSMSAGFITGPIAALSNANFDKYNFICYECRLFAGLTGGLGGIITNGQSIKLYHSAISPNLSTTNNLNGIKCFGGTCSLDLEDTDIDMSYGGGSTGTGNVAIKSSTGNLSITLKNTKLIGGTGGGSAYIDNASSTLNDLGGNVVSGGTTITGKIFNSLSITGTSCATGNWALTSGWGTSSIASVTAGGDSHRCQVVITGAAGSASPVLTWTFPTAYLVAPGSCQITFNGTLTGESTGAPSTSSVAFTFTGTPSAQTYRLDASCGP